MKGGAAPELKVGSEGFQKQRCAGVFLHFLALTHTHPYVSIWMYLFRLLSSAAVGSGRACLQT